MRGPAKGQVTWKGRHLEILNSSGDRGPARMTLIKMTRYLYMLPKFRETKRQGGRCRLCEDQDSAGFEKRSERQKEGPQHRGPKFKAPS